MLTKVAADASARQPIQVALASTLTPGTVLLRDWRGTQHQVIIRDELRVPRQAVQVAISSRPRITGTKWSGTLFFGLRVNGEEHADGSL
jgi:hypothetical protein